MRNVNKLGSRILDRNLFQSQGPSPTYATFFFRNDVILGHTPNIQLVRSSSFDGSHLLKKINFQKVVKLNDSQMTPTVMDEIVRDPTESVKPADIQRQTNPLVDSRREGDLTDELPSRKQSAAKQKELVFLHSSDSIIEK